MAQWKYFSGVEFVWNGAYNDATLIYKGHEINSHIVEDSIWDNFNEYCEEVGIEANEENFTDYCNNNQDEIEMYLELAIGNEI